MSFQFPSEIKDLVKSLHDDTKWRVLELLIDNQKLSYTQIKNKLAIGDDASKGTLNYHLKELQKSGWIRNWIEDLTDLSDNQKSFYAISKFGSKVIEGIMEAMDIESYKQDLWEEMAKRFARSTQPSSSNMTPLFLNASGILLSAATIFNTDAPLLHEARAITVTSKRKLVEWTE